MSDTKTRTRAKPHTIAEAAAVFTPTHPDFIADVEALVDATGSDYIDCCLEVCFRRGIDQENVVGIIKSNKQFRGKLEASATKLNFLKHNKRKGK